MRTTLMLFVVTLQAAAPAFAQSLMLLPPPAPRDVDVSSPSTAAERGAASSFRSFFTDFGHDLTRLPSKSTAITLALGGVLAIAVHPADRMLTQRAAVSEPLDEVLDLGAASGSGWTQVGAALATAVVGRATGNRRVQAVGRDLIQGQIVACVITEGIKLSVDRTRPSGGRYSFPSGHTASTFATATVLSRHFGWKVGVPAYGVAAYVGASRLPENRHYASDVIVGAAIGIVAGRTVTVGRGGSRFAVSPFAVPGGAGVTFTHVP